MSSGRTPLPAAAVAWMAPGTGLRVLHAASGRATLVHALRDLGHVVVCVDAEPDVALQLAERARPTAAVAAKAEALPFRAGVFDRITVGEGFTRLAPGIALPEFARVLRPGGRLAFSMETRDDTVPWVRKLAAIVQRVDPEAMQGRYGTEELARLAESGCFGEPERRDFRNWVPIARSGLVDMVARRPAFRAAPQADREAALAQVGELYDSYARVPDPLLLPFRTTVWSAPVDHSALRVDEPDDDGLRIPVGFRR